MPRNKTQGLEHLLFAAYLILFAWLVTKTKFFTKSGLTHAQLVIIFLLKVMAGIIYGWIGVYYGELAQMVDTWSYHTESLQEYQLLLSHPGEFFSSLFHNSYKDGYIRFLSENSWWNDLKGNFFIKILAIFNVLSFGHYYINVIFYSFLTLFGPVAVYRVMQDVFPARRAAVLLASFLVPSFLYWTSGLHKDGMIFIGLALVTYYFYFALKEKQFSFPRILGILLGFLLVLGLRNFYVLPLIPALIAWVLSEKTRFRPAMVFATVYILVGLIFFTARYIHPRLDFPAAVVDKQQAFLNLNGGSSLEVHELEPTFRSFLVNLPQAISLSSLRPYPADVHHLLSLAAAMEIGFLFLLFLIFLLWRYPLRPFNTVLIFGIVYSISLLLMIGYSNNNIGAIVRYRSVILPFLVIPMAAYINWKKVGQLFAGDIAKNKIQ